MSERRLPDFLVIGAMKAATTTLCNYLAEHPGAFIPPLKEPDFFVAEKTWSKGFDWYSGLFADAAPGVLLGEGSTNYTKAAQFPGVPARIHEHVPGAKLIYLLRDPIDRMRSNYVHRYLTGHERRPATEALVPGSGYLDTSLYGKQLAAFREYFPPEQILVVLNEDLRDDPGRVLTEIEAFLGLAHHEFPDLGRRDHDSSARRIDRGFASRLRQHPKLVLWVREHLPRSVRSKITRRMTDEVDTSTISVPDSVFTPLLPELAADRELLLQLCPLDLGKWRTVDPVAP